LAERTMFGRKQEVYVHLVWSTWDRVPVLGDQTREWLWPALAEQARSFGCAWAVVGGPDDHVHVLCALPTTVAIAGLVQHLKGWPLRAANAREPDSLGWQGGYGAFSVTPADVPGTECYVREQAAHHRNRTFDPAAE